MLLNKNLIVTIGAFFVLAGGSLAATNAQASTFQNQKKQAQKHGYVISNDGKTVTDTKTGLMWMRCPLGKKLTSNKRHCRGSAARLNWDDALKAGKKLSHYAGYNDWRLPTIKELYSLVYCNSGKYAPLQPEWAKKLELYGEGLQDGRCQGDYRRPTIVKAAFPNTNKGWFWSASPNTYGSHDYDAWLVYFGVGNELLREKYNHKYVRLVRGGQ